MNAPAAVSVRIWLLTDAGHSHNIQQVVFDTSRGRFEKGRRALRSAEMKVDDTLGGKRIGGGERKRWKRRGLKTRRHGVRMGVRGRKL